MRIRIYIRSGKWPAAIANWESEIDNYVEKHNYYARENTEWSHLKNAPITHMPVLIHDSWDVNPNNHLVSPRLTLEESSAGSLTFTIHKKHPYWKNGINLMTDTLYVVREDRIWWDGRPISYDQDIDGNLSVTCEGALAYFNDTLLPSWDANQASSVLSLYEFMWDHFITSYNDQISPLLDGLYKANQNVETERCIYNDRLFYASLGTWFKSPKSYYWNPNYESHMEWLRNYILTNFQARCKIVYPENALNDYLLKGYPIPRFLIIFSDFTYETVTRKIPIKRIDFGKNLTSFTLHRELNPSFATSVLPRGKTLDDTSGREFKTFKYLIGEEDKRRLERFLNAKWTSDTVRRKKEALKKFFKYQLRYGVISKYVDFPNLETAGKLLDSAVSSYNNTLSHPFSVATVSISGFDDGEASVPADGVTTSAHASKVHGKDRPDTELIPEKIFYNSGKWYSLYIDRQFKHETAGAWPSYINYRVCDPKYFDIWTRIKATTSMFDDDDKQWNIIGMDVDLTDPYVPSLTLEKYSHKITDSYMRWGAQIGDVAGKFSPKEES